MIYTTQWAIDKVGCAERLANILGVANSTIYQTKAKELRPAFIATLRNKYPSWFETKETPWDILAELNAKRPSRWPLLERDFWSDKPEPTDAQLAECSCVSIHTRHYQRVNHFEPNLNL